MTSIGSLNQLRQSLPLNTGWLSFAGNSSFTNVSGGSVNEWPTINTDGRLLVLNNSTSGVVIVTGTTTQQLTAQIKLLLI